MNKLEIIATSVEDITYLNTITQPIEIELCADMNDGGLTPDIDLVAACVNKSKHPVRVMIRNHDQGFYYHDDEINKMIGQIKVIKKLCRPAGFVFGCLTNDQKGIHFRNLQKLEAAATTHSNTFHRAIDSVIDAKDTIMILQQVGIKRILTTGGPTPILNNSLALTMLTNAGFDVLAGGGVNHDNAAELLKITNHIHTGSAIRVDNSFKNGFDQEKVNELLKLL